MIILIEKFEQDIMNGKEWSGLRGNVQTQVRKFENKHLLNKYVLKQKNNIFNYEYEIIENKFEYIISLLKEYISQSESNLTHDLINNKINYWLIKKISHLNNQSPLEMIIKKEYRKVINLLEQLIV